MTDIFFSYSSADRERVRPIRDALVAQGFEVFWDQQVPAGMDWDTWIRQHLTKSKCAMAFWSATSVSSDNVRHEATVAKQQGKLISVLLEPLTAEQFPMGLYAQQAANLSDWSGDYSHDEWRKFRREFEAKLTPLWVRRQIDEIEAELVGERTRREGAERRDRTMQAQIAKEVEVQQYLKEERNIALDEVAALKGTVEKLTQARADATAKQADAQQALKRERDNALDEVAALKQTVGELTQAREHAEARSVELSQRLSKVRQSKAQDIARSIGAAFSPFVIAAALATVGFWTYQLIWSAPQPLPAITSDSTADAETKMKAAEIEQQRLQEEVQGQAKTATELRTKLQAAQAEQQQQARAVVDADSKRKAAEAEQQRLKEEVQRQTKAAADAEAKLKANQPVPAAPATSSTTDKSAAVPASQPAQTGTTGLFRIRTNIAMSGNYQDTLQGFPKTVTSLAECEQNCAQSETCKGFNYDKITRLCTAYQAWRGDTPTTGTYDSGIRITNPGTSSATDKSAALPAAQSAPVVSAEPFKIITGQEAMGRYIASSRSMTMQTCEQSCAQSSKCDLFTLNLTRGLCFLYSRVDFTSFRLDGTWSSGIRTSVCRSPDKSSQLQLACAP
jgi:TIR domain/PAN domain